MLRIPPVEHRADEAVTAQPGGGRVFVLKLVVMWDFLHTLLFSRIAAKEIQLMHRAPVVGIVVLDGHGAPLPEPLEVAHDLARSPDMQGSHHLLVISEEQFKVNVARLSF